jgi:hypothetical protein
MNGAKSEKKPKQWSDMVFCTSTDIKLHDLSWQEEDYDYWGLYSDVAEESIKLGCDTGVTGSLGPDTLKPCFVLIFKG